MMAGMQKAVTAAILALFSMVAVWVDVPEFINEAWLTTMISVAFPVLVYFVPNKA